MGGRTLTYTEHYGDDDLKKGTTVPLLQTPGVASWQSFTCLNSLREVEPQVKLILMDGGLDEIPDPGQRGATSEEGESP